MANVQFEEEDYIPRQNIVRQVQSKMAARLIKWGLVRNEKQALRVLFAFSVFCFLLSGYLFLSLLPEKAPPPFALPPEALNV